MQTETYNFAAVKVYVYIYIYLQKTAIGFSSSFILCVGGFQTKYLNNVDAYIHANDKWYTHTLSQLHTARSRASATSWNNTVVVAGGLPACNSRSVQQYDLLSNTWIDLPPMIEEHDLFALVNLDGTLVAIGGGGNQDLNKVEQFDVDTSQWKLTASLIEGRYAFGAAVLNVSVLP